VKASGATSRQNPPLTHPQQQQVLELQQAHPLLLLLLPRKMICWIQIRSGLPCVSSGTLLHLLLDLKSKMTRSSSRGAQLNQQQQQQQDLAAVVQLMLDSRPVNECWQHVLLSSLNINSSSSVVRQLQNLLLLLLL
jgi:hypothetical protein